MFVLNMVPIHRVMSVSDLQVALEEKARVLPVSRIHPLGNVNVCTKFHDNLCKSYVSCWDISVKKIKKFQFADIIMTLGNYHHHNQASSAPAVITADNQPSSGRLSLL